MVIMLVPYVALVCWMTLILVATEGFLVDPLLNVADSSATSTHRSSPHTLLWEAATTSPKKKASRGGGGRAPGQVDDVDDEDDPVAPRVVDGKWKQATPCAPGEARLTVVQITDVYTLEHLASVKTMLQDLREKSTGATVISMITGDFLAPYLLSSVDRGKGMMNALAKIPIDYITWGNHEADIDHKTVCRHVREFPGIWLNSNMLDHAAMDAQQEYDVVEVTSPDGSNRRKVGLVAVLSDDPALYTQFKSPGAFGGATIDDPWKALDKYKRLLEGPDHNVDMILPLQHTYVPDDHKTCQQFDFPVVLSGHDHHRVDQIVHGTRLLKPGMDAVYATVLELSWMDGAAPTKTPPKVKAAFVKCSDWEPDPGLDEENERAYDALEPLRNTELARVPPNFEPLSSKNSRGSVTTMGQYICTLLRSSLNAARREEDLHVDAVMLMGGNIRGGSDYPEGSFFSLEALEAEIKSDEVVGVVPMPGWLLSEGVVATHAGDPIPGWMQYDNGVIEEATDDGGTTITQVRGRPLDPDKIYRVATKIGDLTNGQSPPWTEYYSENRNLLPPKGAYVNIQAELMTYFARNLWRRVWDELTRQLQFECGEAEGGEAEGGDEDDDDVCYAEARLDLMDTDHDGAISVEEIQMALSKYVGLSVDDRELALAKFVHSYADMSHSGEVTLADLKIFCEEMEEIYEREKWRLAIPPRATLPDNDDDWCSPPSTSSKREEASAMESDR